MGSAAEMRAGDQDRTYSRRNRHRPGIDVESGRLVMPGQFSPQVTGVAVRDTSGSMGKSELGDAFAEIVGIGRRLGIRGRDFQVIDCDSAAYGAKRFDGAESIADTQGGGGTDMTAGIRAALQVRPKPAFVVVLTDGMTGWPLDPSPIRTIACLVGEHAEEMRSHVPDWIVTVVVD